MRHLESEIVGLQGSAGSAANQSHSNELKDKKAVLEDLLDSKVQGALVRSCFQGVSLMDSLSKNFFSLEKENGESKCIHDVKSSGTLLMGDGEIRR